MSRFHAREKLREHTTISSLDLCPVSEEKAPKQGGWKVFPVKPGPSVSQDIFGKHLFQFRNKLLYYHTHDSLVKWPVKSVEIPVDWSEAKSSVYSKDLLGTLIFK